MRKLNANRGLLGNIALLMCVVFITTFVSGTAGLAAPEITPHVDFQHPMAIEDRDGNWVQSGGTAKLKTTADKRQIKFTIQVLSPEFDTLAFKLLTLQGTELTPEKTDISNVKQQIYQQVYNTVYYIYQFTYTWRYGNELEIGSPNQPNYEFLVATNATVLSSVYLDLETPPPEGGGGGGGGGPVNPPRPAPVPAAGGFINIVGPGRAVLTVDDASIEEILATPGVNVIALVLDKDIACEEGTIEISAEILEKIFNKGKKLLCEIAGNSVLLDQDTFDLAPYLGEGALIRLTVSKSATAAPGGPSYKLTGDVVQIVCRAVSGATDRGAVLFTKPVVLGIAYDQSLANEGQLSVYRYNPSTNRWEVVRGSRVDKSDSRVTCRRSETGIYAVMAYIKTFIDTAGHWAQADIELLASRHVIVGIAPDMFAPERTLTRAEFASLVLRIMGLDEKQTGPKFKDVPEGAWYAGAVWTSTANELLKGYPNGTFRPLAPVTREEIASVIVRVLDKEGKKPVLSEDEVESILSRFRDRSSISSWARYAVAAAVKEGLLTGRQNDLFAPDASATRAEIAAVLKRVLNKLET